MLPFLEPKKLAGSIIVRRGKSGVESKAEVEAPGSEMDPGLKEAATDLLAAINEKSIMGIASALKAAWECCESYEEPAEMGQE